jgi:hypothetical protein
MKLIHFESNIKNIFSLNALENSTGIKENSSDSFKNLLEQSINSTESIFNKDFNLTIKEKELTFSNRSLKEDKEKEKINLKQEEIITKESDSLSNHLEQVPLNKEKKDEQKIQHSAINPTKEKNKNNHISEENLNQKNPIRTINKKTRREIDAHNNSREIHSKEIFLLFNKDLKNTSESENKEKNLQSKLFIKEDKNLVKLKSNLTEKFSDVKITASLLDYESKELKENQIKNFKVKNNSLDYILGNSKEKKDTKHLIEEFIPNTKNQNLKKNSSSHFIEHNIPNHKNNAQNVSENLKINQTNKIELYVKPELKFKKEFHHQNNSYSDKNESKDKNSLGNLWNQTIQTKNIFKNEIHSTLNEKLSQTIKEALEEIISKAKIQLGKDHFSAQIRLNPSIFGFMSVDMQYDNGSIILKILVDNQDVFKKLQENLESIKGEFTKQGLQLDQLQIKFKEASEFNQNQENANFMLDFKNSEENQSNKNFYFEENQNDFEIVQSSTDSLKQDILKYDEYEKQMEIEDTTYHKLSMNFNSKKQYWG